MSDFNKKNINSILIVGGGTAGWIAAAGLSHLFMKSNLNIRLVESQEIGTVGVGEATVPHIRHFNSRLGLDERDFMQKTQATFKLGIQFCDWNQLGDAYVHPFGDYGKGVGGVAFHQHWARARKSGLTGRICDYSLPVRMCEAAKFALPSEDMTSVLSTFSYAYQFDAGLYAAYLRGWSEARGVVRTEGKVVSVEQNPENGFVTSVTLASGEQIAADIFIDCSGFRGLLIEETLKTGYEDWSHWLPCDRAWAVPTESTEGNVPYTRATARTAGWQWRIPLQHRVGNGHVFSSRFTSEQAAVDLLMDNLEAPALMPPKMLKFVTGVRKKQWHKNVIAVGLAGGFLEPLESTSIHLIQLAVTNFAEMLPDLDFSAADSDEYNRVMHLEYERVRDFLVLHYNATKRDDSEFWNYVRTMSIPDSLKYKMELFRARGVVVNYRDGFFLEPSWLAVYLGQGVIPEAYDPLSERLDETQLANLLARLRTQVDEGLKTLPSHADFLERYCPGGMAPLRAEVRA